MSLCWDLSILLPVCVRLKGKVGDPLVCSNLFTYFRWAQGFFFHLLFPACCESGSEAGKDPVADKSCYLTWNDSCENRTSLGTIWVISTPRRLCADATFAPWNCPGRAPLVHNNFVLSPSVRNRAQQDCHLHSNQRTPKEKAERHFFSPSQVLWCDPSRIHNTPCVQEESATKNHPET